MKLSLYFFYKDCSTVLEKVSFAVQKYAISLAGEKFKRFLCVAKSSNSIPMPCKKNPRQRNSCEFALQLDFPLRFVTLKVKPAELHAHTESELL